MSPVSRTASITLFDTRLSYLEVGDGKPVLLLHGNPGGKAEFKPFAESLATAGAFRIFVFDRPGHGNSEELLPETPDAWIDAEAFSEAIRKLCGGKAYVIGYSLGAFTALKIAIRHPELISGLGLIAPFVVPPDPGEQPSRIPSLARGAVLGTILGIAMPMFAPGKVRSHVTRVYEPDKAPEEFIDDRVNEYGRFEHMMATMQDKNDMLQLLKDVHEKMKDIRLPVMAVSGTRDAICDANAQLEKIGITGSCEKTLIENAGHALPFTHTAQIVELLKAHIAKS
ncbi:MAG: alpha/beta hydrolase [Candidatus Riflebacteria bacterium]|nr:alpha/beta hydrolase [Candidatus Riflebacteria bacterium]